MILTGCFEPRVAATGKTAPLAMQRLWLTGQVLPAGARLTVQHVFQSAADGPLEVIYCFALPRDAAMRAFGLPETASSRTPSCVPPRRLSRSMSRALRMAGFRRWHGYTATAQSI